MVLAKPRASDSLKRPEIRIPAWRQLSKRRFSTRCLPKVPLCVKCAKPCASDSLKETRDKDSSLAAALKRWFLQKPGVFRFSQKRPEIRIPACGSSKTVVLAKPRASDSLKETRDKDSSLAAALKTAVFNQMPSKSAILCLKMQSRVLPSLSNRPEIRIPAWRL